MCCLDMTGQYKEMNNAQAYEGGKELNILNAPTECRESVRLHSVTVVTSYYCHSNESSSQFNAS